MSIKEILSVSWLLKFHSQMFLPSSHFLPIRWERQVNGWVGVWQLSGVNPPQTHLTQRDLLIRRIFTLPVRYGSGM